MKMLCLSLVMAMMVVGVRAASSIIYQPNSILIVNSGGFVYNQAILQCPSTQPIMNTASASSLLNAFRWLVFNIDPWPSVSAIWLGGTTNTDGLCPGLLLSPAVGLTFMSCGMLNAVACSTVSTQFTTSTFYVPTTVTLTVQTFTSTTSTVILESVSTLTLSTVQTDVSTNVLTVLDTLVTYTTTIVSTVLTGTATITLSSLVTLTEFRETTTVERTTVTSSYVSGRTTTTTLDSITTRISLTC